MGYWGVYLCVVLFAEQVLANVRLLSCHSVNVIPKDIPTEYVFIATKKEDCTFVFEGPQDTKLDMEVRSISFPKRFTEIENCRKSKLTIYNYSDNKVILGKLVCNENEKASLLTRSNMGIVTSSLTDGSFSIKIRPKIETSDPPRTVSEMQPPRLSAEDYYLLERGSNLVNGGFQPISNGFRPSVPLQQPSYPDTFNAVPIPSSLYHPQRPGFYAGNPTEVIDITYNATGHNFTIVSHKPMTPVGAEETTTHHQPETDSSHPSTVKPLENSSTISAGLVSGTTVGKPTTPSKPTSSDKPTSSSQTTMAVAQASATSSKEPLEDE